jgi:hypothetical protein
MRLGILDRTVHCRAKVRRDSPGIGHCVSRRHHQLEIAGGGYEPTEEHLEGASEKEVAARLGISNWTTHQYVKSIYRRSSVNSRAELLAHFLRRHRSKPTGDVFAHPVGDISEV